MVKEDGITPATPFDDGSGRVDLSKAGNPGLTFDVTAAEYKAHEADLWNVNYPSVFIPFLTGRMTIKRTAHSVLADSSQWALWVEGAEDFNVSVPPVLVVPKNGNVSFNIKINAARVPLGQVRSMTVYLTQIRPQKGRTLHIPVTFIRK